VEGNPLESKEEVFERLKQAVIDGDEVAAKKWAEEAVKRGIDAYEAISKGCLEGMNVVGEKYARREYFIPEVVGNVKESCNAREPL
jgi:methanogenic corrinoid protein MtbC1